MKTRTHCLLFLSILFLIPTSLSFAQGLKAPSAEPIHQLVRFLSYVTHGNNRHAFDLIAPETKKNGDPIAYDSPVDWKSFLNELPVNRKKFGQYHLGKIRWESPHCFRIFVHFSGGDNDEVMMVRKDGKWFVADPIHIIR